MYGKFTNSCATGGFSRTTQLHAVGWFVDWLVSLLIGRCRGCWYLVELTWAQTMADDGPKTNRLGNKKYKHSQFDCDFIQLSMALQPFVGHWPLFIFSFVILHTVGRTPWTVDQPVARPLPTHRTTQTQNKHTQTSMPRVGFEPTTPSARADEDSGQWLQF
jgi:hypothetical protein